jgi:oligopeptide transport system substrate-binding protein
MWKKHLGIAVELENQEWSVFLSNAERNNFQLCRMGWTGDYADPFTFLELLSSDCGNNHSNWRSVEYDRLLREANREQDPAARLEKLRAAEALALAEQPLIPLFVNYQDRHPWKSISIDTEFDASSPPVTAPAPTSPVSPGAAS